MSIMRLRLRQSIKSGTDTDLCTIFLNIGDMKIDKSKLFSNKNLIVLMILLFVGWLMFFDQNSYFDLKGLDDKIVVLERERNFYQNKIHEDSTVINRIKEPVFLEKYARENFFYVRPSEVLYIIEDVDSI